MGTTHDVHRLTIARFDAARALAIALDAIGAAGFASDALCVTGGAETLDHAARELGPDTAGDARFSVLFEKPVPVMPLANGAFAYGTRGSVLARLKGGSDYSQRIDAMACCPLSKEHQQDMAACIQAGALFLIVGAANNEQYIRCQSLLLRHSAGQVIGVQFTW